jgi:hypothetical protein
MANLAAFSVYGRVNGDVVTATPDYPIGVVIRDTVAQILDDDTIVSGGCKVIFSGNNNTFGGDTAWILNRTPAQMVTDLT